MKLPAAASRLVFKPKRYTTLVMMLIIWTGLASSLFAGISTDIRNRDFMRRSADTIAQTIPKNDLISLNGSSADEATLSYTNIKKLLTQVHDTNHDLTYVNLLGEHGDKVFYYANSESPDSDGYAPPGLNYPDAPKKLKNAFISTTTMSEGPVRNRLGVWISAYSPIIDERTGRILAVVTINRSAVSYYTQLALYALVPLLLAVIPLAGLIRDRQLEAKEHEINQLKNQFVSIASHEIRSPLTGMLWAIQSLLKNSGKMPKSQQVLLTDMFRSAESSLSTVNEILDMSVFERGHASKLQQETVDLVMVLKEVSATLTLGVREKHLDIKYEEWPEHAYVIGDVGALKRAYMNLISNAIKYTKEHTTITVSYRLANGEHIISIQDQGIGIPLEEQKKVMEGYYRATNATALQAHGTGLGLWITRLVVEQHGGRLWLNSKLDHGTTIYTALPVGHPKATPLPTPEP